MSLEKADKKCELCRPGKEEETDEEHEENDCNIDVRGVGVRSVRLRRP